jgi:hypothetical protein
VRVSARTTLAAFVLLGACSACAALPGRTPVRSTVTVLHTLPSATAGTTYALIACGSQRRDADHPAYRELVREQLRAQRWVEAPPASARLLIAFTYSIARGRVPPADVPRFVRSAPAESGPDCVLGDTFTYRAAETPESAFREAYVRLHEPDYARILTLVMVESASAGAEKLDVAYVATVASAGSARTLAPVMPALVGAAFAEFPGTSGTTRKDVRLP